MFDLQQAQALYQREKSREPQNLEEWLEERIKERIRDRSTFLMTTIDYIPSRFQHEDVSRAVYDLQDRGFDAYFNGHDINISGWDN